MEVFSNALDAIGMLPGILEIFKEPIVFALFIFDLNKNNNYENAI